MQTQIITAATAQPVIIPTGTEVVLIEQEAIKEVQLVVEKNATATYVALDPHNTAPVKRTYSAAVDQDAKLTWAVGCFGRAQQDCSITTRLVGERATTEMCSAFFTADETHHSLRTLIYHDAPHTTSTMIGKGVVAQRGSADFIGRIIIPKGSVGCRGEQSEDALLLSSDAKLNTTPDLEIATDDVSCNHASTISYISPEKLFYFSGRGIEPAEATSQIIHGHFMLVFARAPLAETGGCTVQISDTIEEVISAL